MVDGAGVNGLRNSNRHKAGDEEGNEGVWIHVGCVVDERYDGVRLGLLQFVSTNAVKREREISDRDARRQRTRALTK